MRVEHAAPGEPARHSLEGGVLTQSGVVGGSHWAKGRRLSAADLELLAAVQHGPPLRIVMPDGGEVHEEVAAERLAAAAVGATGSGLLLGAPKLSRVDLLAATAGVVAVRVAALDHINRLSPLAVFTVENGRVVDAGDIVASVKVAPYFVSESILAAGEAIAAAAAPLVRIKPFRPVRIAVVVKRQAADTAQARFEQSIATRLAGLGAELAGFRYVADDPVEIAAGLGEFVRGAGRARIILTAGGSSADRTDSFFEAVELLGGRVVRHGAPAHPGSMLWLARIGGSAVLGLPSCGAYSHATAVDLLLPRLVAGYPVSAATVAGLAHGGVLDRTQRHRFPPYAQELGVEE